MIHEWRTYRLKPGAAPEYLALFADRGLPLVTRHLPLMGYWLGETGPLNTIHHLWSYADWAERESCRASLATEEAWVKGFIPKAFALVEEQRSRLLRSTRTTAAFDEKLKHRRSEHRARSEGDPLFGSTCAALVAGHAVADAIAVWAVVSGEPAAALSLLSRGGDPLQCVLPAGISHIILRPLAFSPL